jgi:hypothetical protein
MLGYLDAGTGSMVLAAIAGGAAGAGVAVKAGLDKFRRGGRKKGGDAEAEVATDDTEATDVDADADADTEVEAATDA